MDAKDEIIFQQLDVIRSMTENNLRRINDDFWGVKLPKSSDDGEGKPRKKQDADDEAFVKNSSAPAQSPSDAQGDEVETPPESIEDLKKELDSYIGLSRIKREVKNLINMVTVYKMREANSLPNVDMSLHMVFSGNPGTGKTMVARLMARIYRSLGILSKGQLIEVDRSGLVAGYVGQTAIKTREVVDKAKGGVLFVDEAYALTERRGDNDFGQEAVDTLLKAMEDMRDDLVVIVAGYDGLMNNFVHSNPGLESRFNRFLHFDDYTVDEMLAIFKMQADKGCYTIDGEALTAIKQYIEDMNTNSISFGNARGVRNLFENVLVNQANRLAAEENVTRDKLMQITIEDVEMAREEASNSANDSNKRFEDELSRLAQSLTAANELMAEEGDGVENTAENGDESVGVIDKDGVE
ncbi:MAG: AAA family ATPase [Clostridia bacterium]|nr:AAA family ATPase [Clostridia bacterium]